MPAGAILHEIALELNLSRKIRRVSFNVAWSGSTKSLTITMTLRS
jgi:hypothetical protein